MSPRVHALARASQKNEITEYRIYTRLAALEKDPHNRQLLLGIAADERAHYDFWASRTGVQISPNRLKVLAYVLIARVFGLTFGLKLMEKLEEGGQRTYVTLTADIPELEPVHADEERHERELLGLLNERKLNYISSIVLGLNDALVELTGALAGITLALLNSRLIAIVGLITGIAASMSMAASEYLSTKHEDTAKEPLTASLYTGAAYILTVVFLIAPYFIFSQVLVSLAMMLVNALVVILVFTFYISVARDLSFKKRFGEMAGLSLSIAAINFLIGFAIRHLFGVEV